MSKNAILPKGEEEGSINLQVDNTALQEYTAFEIMSSVRNNKENSI